MLIKKIAGLCLLAGALAFPVSAQEGVPQLDHVFVIMMENHGYYQVIDNPRVESITTATHTARVTNGASALR